MRRLLLVTAMVFLATNLTGCGTIGGTLTGAGSDLTCVGEWCADIGSNSSYSNSGDYRPPNR